MKIPLSYPALGWYCLFWAAAAIAIPQTESQCRQALSKQELAVQACMNHKRFRDQTGQGRSTGIGYLGRHSIYADFFATEFCNTCDTNGLPIYSGNRANLLRTGRLETFIGRSCSLGGTEQVSERLLRREYAFVSMHPAIYLLTIFLKRTEDLALVLLAGKQQAIYQHGSNQSKVRSIEALLEKTLYQKTNQHSLGDFLINAVRSGPSLTRYIACEGDLVVVICPFGRRPIRRQVSIAELWLGNHLPTYLIPVYRQTLAGRFF